MQLHRARPLNRRFWPDTACLPPPPPRPAGSVSQRHRAYSRRLAAGKPSPNPARSPCISSRIRSAISVGRSEGMMTMEQSLTDMVKIGRISRDTAYAHGYRTDDLQRYLG